MTGQPDNESIINSLSTFSDAGRVALKEVMEAKAPFRLISRLSGLLCEAEDLLECLCTRHSSESDFSGAVSGAEPPLPPTRLAELSSHD